MKIIGRTNRDIVNALVVSLAAQLLNVAVESLELGEEFGFIKERVEYADGIVGIDSGNKNVSGFLNGFQVPWRNVPSDTSHRKITWHSKSSFSSLIFLPVAFGVRYDAKKNPTGQQ